MAVIVLIVVLGFLLVFVVALWGSKPTERATIIRALAELVRGVRGSQESDNKVIEPPEAQQGDKPKEQA